MMKYKGYIGHVIYDDEAKLLHGEVINIRDVVTFQGQSVDELERAFHDSVDDYLDMCAERGEEPDKPFSGRLVLRLDPELHKASFLAAKSTGKSLNTWIADTLRQATEPRTTAIK